MDGYEPEINMRMSYKLQIFPNKKPLKRGFWKGVGERSEISNFLREDVERIEMELEK
jgi:hypothetical protein